jgi:hypothetical protein
MFDTLVATLATDLPDYPPDSTATIDASGLVYGSAITFDPEIVAADGSVSDIV